MVRKYGVVSSEATIKQELARMGAEGLTGAALEMAKTQARLNLILAGTTDAQGDAARTADSYANVSRGLEAAVLDLKVAIGDGLVPAMKDAKMAGMEFAQSLIEPAIAWAMLQEAMDRGIISFGKAAAMQWEMRLTGRDAGDASGDRAQRFPRQG